MAWDISLDEEHVIHCSCSRSSTDDRSWESTVAYLVDCGGAEGEKDAMRGRSKTLTARAYQNMLILKGK